MMLNTNAEVMHINPRKQGSGDSDDKTLAHQAGDQAVKWIKWADKMPPLEVPVLGAWRIPHSDDWRYADIILDWAEGDYWLHQHGHRAIPTSRHDDRVPDYWRQIDPPDAARVDSWSQVSYECTCPRLGPGI